MKMVETNSLEGVIEYWFKELAPEDWFSGAKEIDVQIRERFGELHGQVAANEFWKYRVQPLSLLAEVLVLDQFSRQIYRGSREAFAYDGQALALAQQAIASGYDNDFTQVQKQFLYMPFMHSESKAIHVEALSLFESLENEESLKFEKIHKDIIDRFGRYPHRNKTLGRTSTKEELKYLEENQEAFF